MVQRATETTIEYFITNDHSPVRWKLSFFYLELPFEIVNRDIKVILRDIGTMVLNRTEIFQKEHKWNANKNFRNTSQSSWENKKSRIFYKKKERILFLEWN